VTAQVPGVGASWRGAHASLPLLVLGCAAVFLGAYAVLLAAGFSDELTILPYHVPALVSLAILARVTPATAGRERLGLLLLAGTILCWDAADWVFSAYLAFAGHEPPFPGIADPLYYVGYLFALGAVPLLAVSGRQRLDARWLLDAAVTMVVATALAWQFLIVPQLGNDGASDIAAATAIGYPVLDLGLLIIMASAFYGAGGWMSPRSAALSGCLLLFVATDGAYAARLVHAEAEPLSEWMDLGWLAVNWGLGLAVLLPSTPPWRADSNPTSVFGAALPYLLATPLVGVLIATAATGNRPPALLSVASVATLGLLLSRQVLTIRDNDRMTRSLRDEANRLAELLTALRESEHFATTVVSSIGEGLVVYDADGRVVLFNPFMERVTGRAASGVIGTTAPAFEAAGAGAAHERWLRRALAGEMVTTPEFAFAPPGGSTGWYAGRYSAFRTASGRTAGAVAVFADVTQQRLTQQALIQSQKMEGLGALAGGVAHDFNNLLTTIMGSCMLVRLETGKGHPAAESVTLIEEAARRGAEISARLLTFARGGFATFAPVDLRDVVRDTLRLAGPSLPASLRTKMELPELPVMVEGDRGQLEQVLLNLLLNARDAMAGNGLVTVGLRADGGHGVIRVTDDGPGMDAGTQLRIFEPFFTTKAPGAGTGLGLAIAYGIAQQHGGAITVASEPGQGARFDVCIPLLEPGSAEG